MIEEATSIIEKMSKNMGKKWNDFQTKLKVISN